MFHKIMVAFDESPEAGRALSMGIELAKALSAELTVVTVLEPRPGYYSFAVSSVPAVNWTEGKRAKCVALQAEAREKASAAGLWIEAELVSGEEVGTMVECTRRHRCDLLILGMRKHWLLAGHTVKDVMERAPCALLGVR